MYQLDDESLTNLQPLVGRLIEAIDAGPHALRCVLSGGATLSCESIVTLGALRIDYQDASVPQDFGRIGVELQGRSIAAIAAGPKNSLVLTLDNGAVLALDGSSDMYEAYEITVAGKTVIV